jgi:signal peptide peptidase SppA
MSITRVVAAAASQPWAMEPAKLSRVAAFFMARLRGEVSPGLTAEEQASVEARRERAAGKTVSAGGKAVAVIPVHGVLSHRAGLFDDYSGGASYESFQSALADALRDPDVGAIVLDVDSPGGTVAGCTEAADAIFRARGQKPIVAVANTMAASAAYWLAAQADELYVTPSGTVGSVGVYMLHEDDSGWLEKAGVKMTFVHAGQYKVEGNSYEPLGEEARAEMQKWVDACRETFVAAVARGRGTSVEDVLAHYGDGRLLRAEDALAAGMVHGIRTLDDTIAALTAPPVAVPVGRSRAAASDEIRRRRAALATV